MKSQVGPPAALAFPRQINHVRIEFDARRANATLGGSDYRAAVAGAKVDQEVAG